MKQQRGCVSAVFSILTIAWMITVTHLEHDQIRVNIEPKKPKDDENEALTTPLSVTGTAEELDQELPNTLTSYVASHLCN
jgi:PRTRC genetic system protein E